MSAVEVLCDLIAQQWPAVQPMMVYAATLLENIGGIVAKHILDKAKKFNGVGTQWTSQAQRLSNLETGT